VYDDSPRAREFVYNQMRLRAVRVIVDVKVALGMFTPDQLLSSSSITCPWTAKMHEKKLSRWVTFRGKRSRISRKAADLAVASGMLHTGTMFAVIVYFWNQWNQTYFYSVAAFRHVAVNLILATALTGCTGYGITKLVEKTILRNVAHAQIEDLFGHLEWIAPALASAGLLIIVAGLVRRQEDRRDPSIEADHEMSLGQSGWIGAVQGLCLPFRGFSRSGATISTGMLAGVSKARAEGFSFALAVILTPPAIVKELLRVIHQNHVQRQLGSSAGYLSGAILPSLIGMVCSFLAGLLALKWLSRWLESDRWYIFGIYCLIASVVVFVIHRAGY
jgi:undecaprenyl-diphosphatase